MYSLKIRMYSLVTALLISGCVPASATVTVYTDRSLWLNVTTNVHVIDFEATGPPGAIVQFNGGAHGDTLLLDSVAFQGFDYLSTGLDLQVNHQLSPDWNMGAVLQGPAPFSTNSRIVATLGAGMFAVGSDIFALDGAASEAEIVHVVLSTGPTVYNATTVAGFASHVFLGFGDWSRELGISTSLRRAGGSD